MKRLLLITLALGLLAGCSNSGGNSSATSYPTPGSGQWAVAFGAQNTIINGNSYALPLAPGTHYVYTAASGLALGKTVTLTYTLTGNATLVPDQNGDPPPPTISLFIWERGDDLTCSTTGAMTTNYRQFGGKQNLQTGTHTLSAVIAESNFTGCYPNDNSVSGFDQAVANAAYMGFTLSGQDFAGHGVDVTSGSATLTINSYTVQ